MFMWIWLTDLVKTIPAWVTSLNFIGVVLVIGALIILLGPPIAGKIILVRKHRYYEAAIRERWSHNAEAFFDSQPDTAMPSRPTRRSLMAATATREIATKPPRGFLELSAAYEGIDYGKALPASERQAEPVQQAIPPEVAARALSTPTEEYRIYEAEIVQDDSPLSAADHAFLADPLGSWVFPPQESVDYLPMADETFRKLIAENWGDAAALDIDTEWKSWDLYDKDEVLV